FRPDAGKTPGTDSRRGTRAYHRGTTIAPFLPGAREPRSHNPTQTRVVPQSEMPVRKSRVRKWRKSDRRTFQSGSRRSAKGSSETWRARRFHPRFGCPGASGTFLRQRLSDPEAFQDVSVERALGLPETRLVPWCGPGDRPNRCREPSRNPAPSAVFRVSPVHTRL